MPQRLARLALALLLAAAAAVAPASLLPGGAGPALAQDSDDGGDDRDDGGDDADDGGGDRGPGPGPGRDGPSFLDRLFGEGGPAHVRGEIIGYDLDASERQRLAAAGFPVLADHALGGLGARVTRFGLPPGRTAPAALAEAVALLPGAVLDLNHLYGSEGTVCGGEECWGAQVTRLDSPPGPGCSRATLAIIDSLPDLRHPSLRAARIEARSFLPEGARPAPSAHGTAVAAILVGKLTPDPKGRPLLPGARLLAAGVFAARDGRAEADAVAILRGLDWAIAGGARVVAFSLAGPPNRALEVGIRAASRRASLVAAAGNNGPRGPALYPAAWPGVLAVTAVDRLKRPYRQGSRGPHIDIAAPGVAIRSAAPGGGLDYWTGTSFAVPFAAAALLRARAETGGDPEKAATLLRDLAEDLGPPGRDPVFGAGLLRSPQGGCR